MGRSSILPGIQVSPYSITRDLYLIYLYTPTLPNEPMHPERKFIRGHIIPRALQCRGDWHSSRERGHIRHKLPPWKCLHFNVVWSNIPFKLKKINSFFDLYGNLIKPHISFNMIRADLLRIWGWKFYGRLLRHQVVDFTLRSSNPTSFARPNH